MGHHSPIPRLELAALSNDEACPPQYPGFNVVGDRTQTRPPAFQIPSFDEVMALNEFEDSLRLPTYQARQLGRYHPYRRPFVVDRSEEHDVTKYIVRLYNLLAWFGVSTFTSRIPFMTRNMFLLRSHIISAPSDRYIVPVESVILLLRVRLIDPFVGSRRRCHREYFFERNA